MVYDGSWVGAGQTRANDLEGVSQWEVKMKMRPQRILNKLFLKRGKWTAKLLQHAVRAVGGGNGFDGGGEREQATQVALAVGG